MWRKAIIIIKKKKKQFPFKERLKNRLLQFRKSEMFYN